MQTIRRTGFCLRPKRSLNRNSKQNASDEASGIENKTSAVYNILEFFNDEIENTICGVQLITVGCPSCRSSEKKNSCDFSKFLFFVIPSHGMMIK